MRKSVSLIICLLICTLSLMSADYKDKTYKRLGYGHREITFTIKVDCYYVLHDNFVDSMERHDVSDKFKGKIYFLEKGKHTLPCSKYYALILKPKKHKVFDLSEMVASK